MRRIHGERLARATEPRSIRSIDGAIDPARLKHRAAGEGRLFDRQSERLIG
jgi:hypothetical protein